MTPNETVADKALVRGLTSVLLHHDSGHSKLIAVQRRENVFTSVFPSEIVECSFADGRVLSLFLKYGVNGRHTGHGFWGGTEYEEIVFREVLEPLSISKPVFYGSFAYDEIGQKCLVLEYVGKSLHLDKQPGMPLQLAARWLGCFHAENERRLAQGPIATIRAHDRAYYLGWARRTSLFAGELHNRYPWLARVCTQFEELISALVRPPMTVVHGEFYPRNILIRNQQVYPIDWQSTAVARGEIDLASLIDGWWYEEETIEECKHEYVQARWPSGAPTDFEAALSAARLYWPLRWLGDEPEWTQRESRRWCFDQLYAMAQQAGLI